MTKEFRKNNWNRKLQQDLKNDDNSYVKDYENGNVFLKPPVDRKKSKIKYRRRGNYQRYVKIN